MEVDSDNELLTQLANGGSIESQFWLDARTDILSRLNKIVHEEFPIPKLPPPRPIPNPLTDEQGRLVSPIPSSSPPREPSSQEADADKENAPVPNQRPAPPTTAPAATSAPTTVQDLEPGQLPTQIADMLADIVAKLGTFEKQPPHTIQRIAELVLRPKAHYRALAAYLHAVDRVVRVTSCVGKYPLPPAIPDMSGIAKDGDDPNDPAAQVAWSNPPSTLGTDEALGGALLTPIPWLTRRASPEKAVETTPGAQIHSESTETIDGPNGIGSIETVTVSVNGVRSAGHTRAITQGELLRQEQRAGVVPVIQLSRAQESSNGNSSRDSEDDKELELETRPRDTDGDMDEAEEGAAEDEDEVPHARGPEEIGVGDTGLQGNTPFHTGPGLDAHDIDVEAAVGRKHEEEPTKPPSPPDADIGLNDDSSDTLRRSSSPGAESTGSNTSATKRGAEGSPEGEPVPKQAKEDEDDDAGDTKPVEDADAGAEEPVEEPADADKMDTTK